MAFDPSSPLSPMLDGPPLALDPQRLSNSLNRRVKQYGLLCGYADLVEDAQYATDGVLGELLGADGARAQLVDLAQSAVRGLNGAYRRNASHLVFVGTGARVLQHLSQRVAERLQVISDDPPPLEIKAVYAGGEPWSVALTMRCVLAVADPESLSVAEAVLWRPGLDPDDHQIAVVSNMARSPDANPDRHFKLNSTDVLEQIDELSLLAAGAVHMDRLRLFPRSAMGL